jgi:hypothetical protein
MKSSGRHDTSEADPKLAPVRDAPAPELVAVVEVGVPIVPAPMVDDDEPIVGIVGVPIVGVVGVPIVGSVGIPMVGAVDVPIVGSVGVPMDGAVDVPMVGSVGSPIVGDSDVPMVVAPGTPIVGVVGVPMVGCVGVPIAGLLLAGIPIVGLVGVPMVGIVVPIVGSVDAPVPSVGERVFMPGVTVVCVESVGELVTAADIGGPKFVRLDGSNNTDCAQTAHGATASAAGTSHFTILFIPPPCVAFTSAFSSSSSSLNRQVAARAVPRDI